jgi:hypothetical protein
MSQEFDTVVIGGTMFACGFSLTAGNCIVIEREAVPGYEFINSFSPGLENGRGLESEEALALKKELEDTNILHDGRISPGALTTVLFKKIKARKTNFLFWTEVTGIERNEDCFRIKLFNASGNTSISAKNVLDTTSAGFLGSNLHAVKGKYINALLNCRENTEGMLPEEFPGKIIPCRFPSEKVYSLEVDRNISWPDARKQLISEWSRRPASLESWRIAACAFNFSFVLDKGPFEKEPGRVNMPSGAYSNPLEAFEAGINCSKRG